MTFLTGTPTRRISIRVCFTLTLCTLCWGVCFTQTYTGNLVLTTQAEVDAFTMGGSPYTQVEGDLTIRASGSITDLSNLSALTSISGGLSLTEWGTDDTAGAGNPLGTLTALTTVGELLIGTSDPAAVPGLQSLGIPQLSSVAGHLHLQQAPNLATASFPALTQTGGDFHLTNLPQLDYFDGPVLATIGGQLRLNELDDLVNLNQLPAVASIGTRLVIRGNDNLTTLDGLSAGVAGGASLTLTELEVEFNQALTSIAGISATIADALHIIQNTNLTNVGRDLTLTTGMSLIQIDNNSKLINVSQIFDGAELISVADVSIQGNSTLRIVGGQELQVTNSITFIGNPQIGLMLNFEGTTSLTGALTIVDNSALTTTHSLRNLTQVAGGVTIRNNDALTATSAMVNTQPASGLTGFSSLERAASLVFDGNGGMENLNDFSSLTVLDNSLEITDNGALGDCCQLPCQVMVGGAAFDTYNPAVVVSNNTGTCADKPAIRSGCAGTGCAAIAPVSWTAFSLEEIRRGIRLHWSTGTETNNTAFFVERSEDGVAYATIGRVKGGGTTRSRRSYRFVDAHPVGGRSYYRLRQVDADGSTGYSRVRTIVSAGNRPGMEVFPNPVRRGSVVYGGQSDEWTGEAEALEVYSAAGRRVVTVAVESPSDWHLDTRDLSPGIYTLRLSGTSRAEVTRLVVR